MALRLFREEPASGDGLELDELLIGRDLGEVRILETLFNGFKGGNFSLRFSFKVCWEGVLADTGVKHRTCRPLELEVAGGGDANALTSEVQVALRLFRKGPASGDGKELGELLIGRALGEVRIVEWPFNGFKDGNFCLSFSFADDCTLRSFCCPTI